MAAMFPTLDRCVRGPTHHLTLFPRGDDNCLPFAKMQRSVVVAECLLNVCVCVLRRPDLLIEKLQMSTSNFQVLHEV